MLCLVNIIQYKMQYLVPIQAIYFNSPVKITTSTKLNPTTQWYNFLKQSFILITKEQIVFYIYQYICNFRVFFFFFSLLQVLSFHLILQPSHPHPIHSQLLSTDCGCSQLCPLVLHAREYGFSVEFQSLHEVPTVA